MMNPTEVVIENLLEQIAIAQRLINELRKNLNKEEEKLKTLSKSVKIVAGDLPEERYDLYMDRLGHIIESAKKAIKSPKYASVLERMSKEPGKEWTPGELLSVGESVYEVYNCLNYLERKDHIIRTSHGRYRIMLDR